jgi:hypothetical protein
LWEKWKARAAHNFPRRFLQRTLLPRFGIDPYSSVLFLNTHSELSDMAACAMHRFAVVRDLADTFASLNLKGISDCDLTRVTSAVHLLMREGCAILNVIQARAVQREEAYKTPV